MKRLAISAVALVIASVPAVALAGGESGGMRGGHRMGGQVMGGMKHGGMTGVRTGGVRNWGGHSAGRWVGGHRAPGGWNAYRRPSRGFTLPSYWIQPSFYIPNYVSYGFAQPSYGYGWSRYYNDAVLTDRYGRVYDSVPNVNWDGGNGEDYSDSYGYAEEETGYDNRYYDDPYYGNEGGYRDNRAYRGKDRDGGLGGALIGGAVGAVAGNVIAGKGERLAGSLIGGGVGALAGAAIDVNDRDGRGLSRKRLSKRDGRYDDRDSRMDYDYGYDAGGPHWGGSAPARPRGPGPVVTHSGGGNVVHTGGGYHHGGYGYVYGQPTVTTVIVQPAPVTKTVTTTTEYVTETVYVKPMVKRVSYKPAPKKVWRPKAKPRCVCKVVYR